MVIIMKMKTVILILVWSGDRRDHTSPITAKTRIPVFKLQEQQQKLYFDTTGAHFIVNVMVPGYPLRPGTCIKKTVYYFDALRNIIV
jgi:hypothetical protein